MHKLIDYKCQTVGANQTFTNHTTFLNILTRQYGEQCPLQSVCMSPHYSKLHLKLKIVPYNLNDHN